MDEVDKSARLPPVLKGQRERVGCGAQPCGQEGARAVTGEPSSPATPLAPGEARAGPKAAPQLLPLGGLGAPPAARLGGTRRGLPLRCLIPEGEPRPPRVSWNGAQGAWVSPSCRPNAGQTLDHWQVPKPQVLRDTGSLRSASGGTSSPAPPVASIDAGPHPRFCPDSGRGHTGHPVRPGSLPLAAG